ncbi:AfsR/SARP family transcriptional regulator [Nocardioides speluncae]|uniref:AfsR/SARP family transcriptional regulator n=1 Tax=Nocardioides speluncae TaxID=2670337 RepID=UPI0012B17E3B|nr:BTAD domain-containing putative transcriptional regulator [Nocardioides speluncae]
MRIEVLGAFRLLDGSQEVAFGGRVPRLTLAALASQPGRPLSVDRMIDHIWAARPPKSARNSLQIAVHRLRRVLGEQAIEYRDNGYRLCIDEEQVDACRFERLAGQAHELHGYGDFDAAASLYMEALGMWSGSPYDGFDEDMLVREASRLSELRLVTLDRAYEVALRLGRHTEVAAQLPTHVSTYPLHEGLRAHLMLALYRCGRQAEALEVYREGRVQLIEELGLEPGPQLRGLEADILSSSPDLDWLPPVIMPVRASRPTPAELPPMSPVFTGRHDELTILADALTGSLGSRLVCVSGAGGSGKSALSVQAAHHAAAEFPDGQLYVNLQGAANGLSPPDTLEVLNRFIRALGEQAAPVDVDEAGSTYRTATAARRLLILLDNAAEPAQVRALLPGGDGCGVVVTSRAPLTTLDGATQLRLGEFSDADAHALLSRIVDPSRLGAEPQATSDMIRLCGRWPLALRIVGARLDAEPGLSVGQLAERMRSDQERLDVLEYGDLAVRSSVAVGMAAVADGDAHRLFLALCTLDMSDFAFGAIAALMDSPGEARRALDQLVAHQLVEPTPQGRYALHDLVRLVGREAATDELRGEAATRIAHYYLASARAALRRVYTKPETYLSRGLPPEAHRSEGEPFADAPATMQWVAAEQDNLPRVATLALEYAADGPAVTVGLVNALDRPLTRGAWFDLLVRMSETGVAAATRAGNHGWLAAAHANTALALQRSGRVRDPQAMEHLAMALESAHQADDVQGVARCHNIRAVAYLGYGDPAGARDELVAARQTLGDTWPVAPTPLRWAILLNLGIAFAQLGEHLRALEIFASAEPVAAELGDVATQATLTYSVGKTLLQLGRHPEAVEHLTRAVQLSQGTGDRLAEAAGLWTLGDVHRATGELDHAQELRRRSLALLNETGAVSDQEMAAVLADPNAAPPSALAAAG